MFFDAVHELVHSDFHLRHSLHHCHVLDWQGVLDVRDSQSFTVTDQGVKLVVLLTKR